MLTVVLLDCGDRAALPPLQVFNTEKMQKTTLMIKKPKNYLAGKSILVYTEKTTLVSGAPTLPF